MELSMEDIDLIVHALYAVAPSGGGSPQFHLANKLAHEHKVVVIDRQTARLQLIAHREVTED